jgi:hypothetical protein
LWASSAHQRLAYHYSVQSSVQLPHYGTTVAHNMPAHRCMGL